MSSTASPVLRSIFTKPFRRRPIRSTHQIRAARCFCTTPPTLQSVINTADRPRWSETPPTAKAPVPHRPGSIYHWEVNTDPAKLDAMYVRFLGPDGHRMLTEEVKWLAMTHKSFDHGRRGFNDRLAYLGHRILRLQTTLALLDTPPTPTPEDPYDRTPVTDPALRGLENLSDDVVAAVLDKKRVAGVASRSGIGEVLRWTPHKPYDLHASGISNVLAEALFAVVGAVSLQKGGEVAAKVARERILNYLIPKERRRV